MFAFFRRIYLSLYPTEVPRTDNPLRFGILGAANIAPNALILPAKTHADVVIAAVAARDKVKADAYAKKYGIPKTYGGKEGYQALLDDPDIDVIYNPLPNGLHYEWTMKALAAGKHVLLEKPSADRSEETRKMFEFAQKKGLVLLEAFHYRFHPAMRRTKTIIDAGEIGDVKHIDAALAVPSGFFKANDIRFQYDLGGGSFMDMGCYVTSVARHIASTDPLSVTSATPTTSPKYPNIDLGMRAELVFPGEVTATLNSHFALPPRFGFIPQFPQVSLRLTGTNGELELFNFVGPHMFHTITVKSKEGKKRTETAYGIDGWSTYRYQLEAFVDRVRGRTPEHWYDAQDSVANLEWIEKVYEASGLGVRPASTYEATLE